MIDETKASNWQHLEELRTTSLTMQLSALNAALNRHAAQKLRPSGLTLLEWRVLFVLDKIQPTTSTLIAEVSMIDRGQLSRTIAKMQKNGLLEAEESETDLRMKLIKMTEAGRARHNIASGAMTARRDGIRDSLSEEQNAQLLESVSAIIKHLNADYLLAEPSTLHR